MKVLKTSAICVLFCVCYFSSAAQGEVPLNLPDHNKPQLFADLPQKMKLRVSSLEELLELPVGASVKTFLADNFNFHGTVVSRSVEKSTGTKSVVIKSSNRKDAVLSFSKIYKPDGTARLLGQIMSFKNGDAYEIVKEDDQYILQKKILYEIISE